MLNSLAPSSDPSRSAVRKDLLTEGFSGASGGTAEEALAVVQHTLEKLGHGSAPGLEWTGQLKDFLAKSRIQAREINRGRGGRDAGQFLSELIDRLLRLLLDFAGQRTGLRKSTPGLALLALGSYGRRELAPYSDLDLLILHSGTLAGEAGPKGGSRLETLAGFLLRPLWDAGLNLGHVVRTPEECLALMGEAGDDLRALETATALLEARMVAGDGVLANLFLKKDLPEFFKRRGKIFVEAKLEEAIARHGRLGTSVFHTQPHLKDSRGGLRDYQLALWIDRASQLSGHLPRLAKRPLIGKDTIEEASAGYERMLTLRTALHTVCGRKQDVFDYAMQQALAAELGVSGAAELRGSEILLREYFRAAGAVNRLADTVIRRYREEQAIATRDFEKLRRRPIDEDFVRVGDFLYASRRGLFERDDWLALAMRVFLHVARLGLRLSQEIAAGIRTQLPRLDDTARRDPTAAHTFLELLTRRARVAQALRAMRDVGLLGQYLPEFGEIEGLVIQDVFHDYSVDEHTLFAVDCIDRYFQSFAAAGQVRQMVLDRLQKPELLRLACLLHDLGKSRGGPGHSARGALMVPAMAERLGLSPHDTKTLIFLVKHHLLLSRTSSRRDTGEGSLLQELAQTIGSRERLDLLYLLTCADSSAVGQGSFTHWKDELLSELYLRIDHFFDPQGSQAFSPAVTGRLDEHGNLEAELLAAARDDEDRMAIREHCAYVPARYLVEVAAEEARLHVDLIQAMRAQRKEALADVRGSGPLADVWIVSTDRPRRFCQIAGAFLGSGVNVVSAIAYTRRDKVIVDRFRCSLAPEFGIPESRANEAFWAEVAGRLGETLDGRVNFREMIEAARRRIPPHPPIARRVEPEVRFDNKLSERYTVLDVACGDRVGVMYALCRALGDLHCDIHFAKVDTQQDLATFVFYVTEIGGGQIRDPEKAHNIRLLLKAVAEDFQTARR